MNLAFFNLFGAALVRRVVSFGGNREHLNRIYTLSLWITVANDPSKYIVSIRVSFKVEPISTLDGSSTMIDDRGKRYAFGFILTDRNPMIISSTEKLDKG